MRASTVVVLKILILYPLSITLTHYLRRIPFSTCSSGQDTDFIYDISITYVFSFGWDTIATTATDPESDMPGRD